MAEQSAFLTAFDEMQKKKLDQQGFNAPAPMESVVDTVGQAPAMQSPFGQQAGMDAISRTREVNPYYTTANLVGSPRVVDAIAANSPHWDDESRAMMNSDAAKRRKEDAFLAGPNPLAAPIDLAAPPAVQAPTVPQDAQDATERARIEGRLAQTNADIIASGETVPSLGAEAPKEGFMPRLVGKLGEQFTQPAPYTPQGGGAEAETAFGATPTQPTLFREGLSALSELNKTPLTSPDSFQPETPSYGASDIPVPPAVEAATPAPVMDGSQIPKSGEEGFKFAERGSPQDYFLSQTNDGTTPLSPEQIAGGQEYAKQQGLNFDPTTGFSKNTEAPQVQAPQGLTTAGGQPLAEFLAGGQQLDAQGRMIDPNVDRSSFEQKSADRESRQAARPDFGEAQERAAGTVTDRERRAARGDGMSDADRRDIAKANQRGASAGDVARGMKVAKLNNIDLKTGKPLEGVSGKELAETGKIRAETAQILSEIGEKSTELNLTPAEESRDKTAGTALAKWDDSGRATVTSNITALDSITKGLEDGQIKTRGFIDALPFGSDWARAIVNPDAQDAKNRVEGVIFQTLKETLGAQFTEKEGKRLVEASYNPMLSPEANAARLRDYSNGLKKAVGARESQMAYLKENKTLQGYDGATPEGIMSQVGSGGGGSQIQGDVNYQSDTQSKADQILSAQ